MPDWHSFLAWLAGFSRRTLDVFASPLLFICLRCGTYRFTDFPSKWRLLLTLHISTQDGESQRELAFRHLFLLFSLFVLFGFISSGKHLESSWHAFDNSYLIPYCYLAQDKSNIIILQCYRLREYAAMIVQEASALAESVPGQSRIGYSTLGAGRVRMPMTHPCRDAGTVEGYVQGRWGLRDVSFSRAWVVRDMLLCEWMTGDSAMLAISVQITLSPFSRHQIDKGPAHQVVSNHLPRTLVRRVSKV